MAVATCLQGQRPSAYTCRYISSPMGEQHARLVKGAVRRRLVSRMITLFVRREWRPIGSEVWEIA